MTAEQLCDPQAFKRAMGQFATGVAVVTALDAAGGPRGMTVSSLTSVSLAPPLLLYGLDRSAVNFANFAEAKAFAFNILARDQEALSNRFADPGRPDWPDLPWRPLVTGAPLIDGAAMAIDTSSPIRISENSAANVRPRRSSSTCSCRWVKPITYEAPAPIPMTLAHPIAPATVLTRDTATSARPARVRLKPNARSRRCSRSP